MMLVVMLVVGCGTAEACKPMAERIKERVHLVGVRDVTHLSTSGMNLYVEVDNDTIHRFVINDAEMDILSKGEVIATISLRDKVVIKGHRSSTVLVPLRFKARSSFVLGRLLTRLLGDSDAMTLNYTIRGGIGPFRRTFEAEGLMIDELLPKGMLRELIGVVDNR